MIRNKKASDKDKAAESGSSDAPAASVDNSFAMRLFAEDINDKANGWRVRTTFKEPKKGLGVNGTVCSKKMAGFPVDWTRSEAVMTG